MPSRQAGSRESALYGSSAPPTPLTRARRDFSLSWTIVDRGTTWPSRASLILPEVGFPWPQTTATMFLGDAPGVGVCPHIRFPSARADVPPECRQT